MAKGKIIILCLLGVILFGIIFIPGYLRIRRLSRQNRELEQQIRQIEQLNTSLSEEHQRLLNDPFYLEKVARKKLGVAKKGEVVYKVVPPREEQ